MGDPKNLSTEETLAELARLRHENERLRAERDAGLEEGRRAELRARAVIDQSLFSTQVFAPDGTATHVNEAFERMWGISRETLLAQGYNVLHDQQLEAKGLGPILRRAFVGEAGYLPLIEYDPNEQGFDARRRFVEAAIYPVKNAAGQVQEVVLVHRDVTARQEAELALKEAHAALDRHSRDVEAQVAARTRELAEQRNFVTELLDQLPAGMAYYGPDLRIRLANAEYARQLHRRVEDVIGKHVMEVFGEPGRVLEAELQRIVDTGQAINSYGLGGSYEFGGRTYSGVWDVTRNPILDEDGRVTGIIILMIDISERQKLTRALEAQRMLIERIIRYAPLMIAYLDENLVYRWNNPLHSQAFGLSTDQIVGKSVREILAPETLVKTERLYREVLASGEVRRAEGMVLMGKENQGAGIFWDVSYVPVPGDENQTPGLIVIAVDATARVEKEHLQAEQIARLKEVDQLKDQFLSILSHELRTPLNAIMGFASILEDGLAGPLNDKQLHYLGKITTGTDVLLALINDLLDMSRIQAGKFSLSPGPMRLDEAIAEVASQLGALATRKRQHLKVEVAPQLPVIRADRQRVMQILANLLGNAIKFTPQGGAITVRARREDGGLRCEVSDNGPGIAPRDVERLFLPFTQVDASNTRAEGGAGLGLSISKALVEAHGGQIGVVRSEEGGSTFWFTLPCTN